MTKIRDEEIKRLINYAKGLNCPVNLFEGSGEGCHGQFHTDGSRIDVYTKNLSKVYVVLVLIHEIAHLTGFIRDFNRKPDVEYNEAFHSLNDSFNLGKAYSKKDRKILYEAEMADMKYWDEIIMNCNIRIPAHRVEEEVQYNTWCYTYFYEKGDFPSRKQEKAERKRIRVSLKKVKVF